MRSPFGPLWNGFGPAAQSPGREPVVWHLVFTNVDGRSPYAHWILGWFRPGFRHVFALADVPPEPDLLPAGGVKLVQLTTARLQYEFFPGQSVVSRIEYTRTIEQLQPLHVATVAWIGDEDAWLPRGMNCVSVMRALGGMPTKWQTPFDLFCELAQRGSRWVRLWRWMRGRWCTEKTRNEP